ncbi:hypothetical protein EJ04DRAFT_567598 [Polyplosphaeria fusca]|uniref:Uncharacterized protein n=1 Tax=Polyplosphaeria fusca TaxID=682080 RepID=A0A9P4UW18_9PLEO|nr:hypothetical protein EJ04DRAFT_567598 [Polyplosphaeria fusca]
MPWHRLTALASELIAFASEVITLTSELVPFAAKFIAFPWIRISTSPSPSPPSYPSSPPSPMPTKPLKRAPYLPRGIIGMILTHLISASSSDPALQWTSLRHITRFHRNTLESHFLAYWLPRLIISLPRELAPPNIRRLYHILVGFRE